MRIANEKYIACDDEGTDYIVQVQDGSKLHDVPVRKIYLDAGDFTLDIKTDNPELHKFISEYCNVY